MTLTNNSIDWSPATSFAYRNCTHELIEDADGKYQFVPVYRMKSRFMARYFLTFILILIIFYFYLNSLESFINDKFNKYEFASSVCILSFFVVMTLYYDIMTRKIIYKPNFFDIKNNLYFTFDDFIFKQKKEIHETISSIKAIQILEKTVFTKIRFIGFRYTYTAYELNLIFDTDRRRNVICHGCYENIKKDAEKLSKYLDIPILERESS